MKPLVITRWDRDPELTAFVSELLGRVPQTEIRAQALERFGADRTPSLSALGRFAIKWKIRRDLAERRPT